MIWGAAEYFTKAKIVKSTNSKSGNSSDISIYQLLIEKIDLNIQKGIAVSAIFIIL